MDDNQRDIAVLKTDIRYIKEGVDRIEKVHRDQYRSCTRRFDELENKVDTHALLISEHDLTLQSHRTFFGYIVAAVITFFTLLFAFLEWFVGVFR